MSKQLLKTLVVMAVLLSLAAVPAMAQAQNGPLIATQESDGQIQKIDPTTGARTDIPGAISTTQPSAPSVTPDGNTVIYSGDVGGNSELFSVPIDGSAAPTQITSTSKSPNVSFSFKKNPVVSPDGETVYFDWLRIDKRANDQFSLYSVPIEGGTPTLVAKTDYLPDGMKITPDGQYLVYVRENFDTGETTVEARSVNDGSTHTVVDNTQSVENPRFSHLTISPDGQTVVVSGPDFASNSSSLYKAPFSATITNEATIIEGTTVTPWEDPDTGDFINLLSPAFSPDGQSIAYILHRGSSVVEEIRSVPATGGTPTVIGFPGSPVVHQDLLWAPQAVTPVVPEVVEPTDPVNGATEVDKTIQPKATFNTDLDASTVNAQNVRLEVYNSTKQKWVSVTSTPSYDQDTKTITVTPAKSLGSQKDYRVTLSTGIESSTGGKLASPYSWTFTTKQ
jgi:hypothetical protein